MAKRKEKYIPNASIKKSIFAADYKAKIRYYDLMVSAADSFSNYPHWRTNGLSFTLCDYEKHCSVIISHRKFAYEQDNDDISLEKENIVEVIGNLTEKLELNSFTRLGFRRKYLLPIDMSFDEIVTILNIKLFSQRPELVKILPHKIDDLLYRLDVSTDDFKIHITIGPLMKRELPQHLEFNMESHLSPDTRDEVYKEIVSTHPDVSLFFDIDVYTESENIPAEQSFIFVEKAREWINAYVENITGYLFSA